MKCQVHVTRRQSLFFAGLFAIGVARVPLVWSQIEITSFDRSGILEWSNTLPHAQLFNVEWAAGLQDGQWQASWNGLTGIPATAEVYRVSVPMAYRVVAHTNILRSRWTLLFYLVADNEIESDFIPKFCELGTLNSDSNIQIVVQLARNGQDARYGNWHGCERYYITNGIVPTIENAISDWGDGKGGRLVNMASPETLVNFLNWATTLYPADHYALLIGDHGFGWKGLGICWSFAKSILYISDLRKALQQARSPMECLLFDACHMNMVEVLAELRHTPVRYVLASETYGQTDWPYGWMLEGLQQNPHWSPQEFIRDVNERLWTYYSVSNVVEKITLCTTDLSLVPDLITNTAQFVAGVLNTNVLFTEVQNRARAVMSAITNSMVASYMGPHWDNIAYGLAVYFPLMQGLTYPQSLDEYTANRTGFALETQWRQMLEVYYNPMTRDPPHGQLFSIRASITNYLDSGEDEHIDLYDFARRFAEAEPD